MSSLKHPSICVKILLENVEYCSDLNFSFPSALVSVEDYSKLKVSHHHNLRSLFCRLFYILFSLFILMLALIFINQHVIIWNHCIHIQKKTIKIKLQHITHNIYLWHNDFQLSRLPGYLWINTDLKTFCTASNVSSVSLSFVSVRWKL